MKDREKTCCILNLDDDLIAEIFVRLPSRSVMRASAVCKDFRRVAYAHRRPLELLVYSFNAAAAAERNGAPDTCRAVGCHLEAVSVSASARRPARRRLAHLPVFLRRSERLGEEYCVALASCDGLLLLGTSAGGQYVICNPAMSQWAELPRLRRRCLRDLPCYAFREFGFYFHEPSGEYRVLCHVTVDEESRAARYYVLSTGAGKPRRLDGVEATPVHSNCVPSACDMITPAVFRGRLHWLRHPEAGSAGGEMAVFDLADETFSRMASPPTSDDEHLTNLIVADGSLMASEFPDRELGLGVDLWVLGGYRGGGGGAREEIRWERRHWVELRWQQARTMPTWLDVVAADDVEGDVVLRTNNGVVVYNVRSATARVVDVGPGAVRLTRRALTMRESFPCSLELCSCVRATSRCFGEGANLELRRRYVEPAPLSKSLWTMPSDSIGDRCEIAL
ncbi:hypothetical protein QYE76_019991 [Lolium multiflorum]|uniref:F-box domain-containing protein n=1 Tax=Lolium multiflorum TaxID=4521 RepID=A0AAD8R7K4_LOLMU|nr:hypothetical protein QYE76_019991 [Lolium multiflorum]